MGDWNEFAAFMAAIETAKESLEMRPYQECFFRGHRDQRYKLLPSLFRQEDRDDDAYWDLETRMFFAFRARARQLYTANHNDWDVLFHMQHHGVPTRLLDWTSMFGVALYFALLGYRDGEEQTPCLWLLNPYALNNATWGLFRLFNPKYLARDEGINRSYEYGELLLGTRPKHWEWRRLWETPLAIVEPQRSERMFAQSGWFTIHGTDRRPLEQIFGERPGILRKVGLPKVAIPAARKFLDLAGIGHRQLFPDLDGLARSTCDQFGVERRYDT